MAAPSRFYFQILVLFILSSACFAVPGVAVKSTPVNLISQKCCVTGTIYDRKGRPAARAIIIATDEQGKEFVARSDKNGAFRLEGILPGAIYHLEAKHAGGKYQVSVRSFLDGDHVEIRPVDEDERS
jgi:hypothetical protein